jgi:hypothetical protein
MTAPAKTAVERTTATCRECGHHVQVFDGLIAFHRAEGVDCPGIGSPAVLDVDTIRQDADTLLWTVIR